MNGNNGIANAAIDQLLARLNVARNRNRGGGRNVNVINGINDQLNNLRSLRPTNARILADFGMNMVNDDDNWWNLEPNYPFSLGRYTGNNGRIMFDRRIQFFPGLRGEITSLLTYRNRLQGFATYWLRNSQNLDENFSPYEQSVSTMLSNIYNFDYRQFNAMRTPAKRRILSFLWGKITGQSIDGLTAEQRRTMIIPEDDIRASLTIDRVQGVADDLRRYHRDFRHGSATNQFNYQALNIRGNAGTMSMNNQREVQEDDGIPVRRYEFRLRPNDSLIVNENEYDQFINGFAASTINLMVKYALTKLLDRWTQLNDRNILLPDNCYFSIQVNRIPVNNADEIQYESVTTPNFRYRPDIRSLDATIGNTLLSELEDLEQSNRIIDLEALAESGIIVTIQYFRPPRIDGWLPRSQVCDYYEKSTVRFIPHQFFNRNNICIVWSVLLSSCREIDATGNVKTIENQVLDIDEKRYLIFNNAGINNVDYYCNKRQYLNELADDFLEACNIELNELSINNLDVFAQLLNVQIHVWNRQYMFKEIHTFGSRTCSRHVTILLDNGHAYSVTRPWILRGKKQANYWCDKCGKELSHTLSDLQVCKHRVDCNAQQEVDEDKITHHGREYVHRYVTKVFAGYKQVTTGVYCRTCSKFVSIANGPHKLNDGSLEQCSRLGHDVIDNVDIGECTTCQCLLPTHFHYENDTYDHYHFINNHCCIIQKTELKCNANESYWVWDIESIMDDDIHIPIYIYARMMYDESINIECYSMEEFCNTIINEKYKDTTWIAHNSGGYDVNFLHDYLEDHGITYDKIPSPTSVNRSMETKIEATNQRFIDSYCFLPMALSKIGPAFQLPIHKGDFPHKFSKEENIHYEGCMPSCDDENDWYSLKSLRASSTEKAISNYNKFITWHNEEKMKYTPYTDIQWKYMNELIKYCKLDCDVLASALACLRDGFMNVDGEIVGTGTSAFKLCAVDPLAYITMAQVCQILYVNGMYHANNPLQISHIPLPVRMQVPERIQYLEEIENVYRLNLHKASTHFKEYYMRDGTIVDGYATLNNIPHVFEYFDCIESGCPQCTDPVLNNERYGCPNESVYNHIQKRLERYRQFGCIVHQRWKHECDYAKIQQHHKCMIYQRQIGDGGFYGGRVEVFKPYYECNQNEKIQYIDVVSLYPWVCAMKKMCTGIPTILRKNEIDRSLLLRNDAIGYFGYTHVKIQGNAEDYFGGVPRRDKDSGRLVFDNSSFDVICFIDELRERVRNGAVVLDVYEVWTFEGRNACIGPMRGYVSRFLRDKMECSGWKALCGKAGEELSMEEKEEICNKLEEENLGLCKPRADKVCDNPGGRQLAKLRLNMLWGKFVQTPQSRSFKFIESYNDYVELFYDNQIDKRSLAFRPIRGCKDVYEVKYTYNNACKAPKNTHFYLGASCTAQARLKLTSMLRQVGPTRALYCDTDSVVYVQRNNEEIVQTGEALGSWSSELDNGVWGVQFLALAPKCYLLKYNEEGKEIEKESGIIKTKGITLTKTNLQHIQYDTMKRVIFTEVFGDYTGEDKEFVVHADTFNIRMDMTNDRRMTSVHGTKIVQCVYSKRKIIVDHHLNPQEVKMIDTIPFSNVDYN